MKKNIAILILISFLILPTQQIQSLILIQIEVGDQWIYYVEGVGNVTFESTNIDYYGSPTEQIRINKISETVFVEPVRFVDVLTDKYTIINMWGDVDQDTSNTTMQITDATINQSNKEIWRSARGNLLIKMLMNVSLVIQFTDTYLNNIAYPDYQVTINDELVMHSTNINIIETVATGTVQINQRSFQIQGSFLDEDFLNMGLGERTTNYDLKFYFDERYEASDGFVYQETNCRNITITPLDGYFEISWTDESGAWDHGPCIGPVELGSISNYKEDWIYAYDAGLPLEIVQTLSTTSSLNAQGESSQSTEKRKMTLLELDVTNANFTFPTETTEPTEKTISPLIIMILSFVVMTIIVIFRKNHWEKKEI